MRKVHFSGQLQTNTAVLSREGEEKKRKEKKRKNEIYICVLVEECIHTREKLDQAEGNTNRHAVNRF